MLKTSTIFLVLLSLPGVVSCSQERLKPAEHPIAKESEPDGIGPYSLFQGTYEFVETKKNGLAEKQTAVFRIDTATGKVWMLEMGMDHKGRLTNFWYEIPEQPPKNN